MRFGLKIFLMSFTLVVVVTNIIGLTLINNTYTTNIQNAIDKHIVEINNIMNNMIYSTTDDLVNIYYNNKTYTKIYINDVVFSTNFPENYPKIENLLLSYTSSYINEEIYTYISDNKLFMAHKDNSYTIITMSDISDIYELRDNEINYFIKVSLSSSLIVAIILSVLVSLITRKLKRLNNIVKEIEKGDYNVVIPNLGNDEIGEFAKSFNKMTKAINDNINEIKTISENRRIFIGNLTHEIRTPLTSIIGYSSLIKNKKIKDANTIEDYATKIYEEGKYIEDMRDKLMNILTLETSKIELKKTNISKLLSETIKELEVLYPKTKFVTNIKSNINKEIDKTLFKSLVINIVKNGINASNDPIITINLTNEVLSIKDNGKGIPKNDLDKIKEPFYTVNKNRNREVSGMGLGIPLCLNIVNIHHWTFDITSIENKGTEVIITLGEKLWKRKNISNL